MMRFERSPEPPRFDEQVRKPGNAWLAANPDAKSERFPDLWTKCCKDLAASFSDLCGYSAMWTSRPTVDHYICRASREGRPLAYEWTNYRLADGPMNAAKGTWDRRILDPFEVRDDWFEVRLPNLELDLVEERIPLERRDDARFTVRQLGLRDSEEILEIRRSWYDTFVEGDVTLAWLARRAPLIARAVKKRLDELNPADFDDEQSHFRRFVSGVTNLKTLRLDAPRVADAIDVALRGR
jgi:hypothetical protein